MLLGRPLCSVAGSQSPHSAHDRQLTGADRSGRAVTSRWLSSCSPCPLTDSQPYSCRIVRTRHRAHVLAAPPRAARVEAFDQLAQPIVAHSRGERVSQRDRRASIVVTEDTSGRVMQELGETSQSTTCVRAHVRACVCVAAEWASLAESCGSGKGEPNKQAKGRTQRSAAQPAQPPIGQSDAKTPQSEPHLTQRTVRTARTTSWKAKTCVTVCVV